ncbi:efflux RND transporter periplasmic adaptor subunit [Caldimonas tepidiphila]|uniref:efflux RND transporter periplasmic adaptor subunit n=1 Tax=Caldimonas tepidiphila TaxID=2315841 RepID=UPI001F0C6DEF|nr:efflux RND transporter periplasmic adaptor subunit [Caldimonas tepidiphila]
MAIKKLHATVAVVGIAVLSGAAWWWQHRAPAPAADAPTVAAAPGPTRPGAGGGAGAPGRGGPVAVEVAQVRTQRMSDEAQAVGTLRSRQSVVVRPEVAGRIVAIGFRDGQPVRRGQMLFQLDDTLPAAELKQAEAQASIARANHRRNEELVAQNFVSRSALEQTAANLAVAEAQVALAKARVARLRIVAPFDASAGIRLVNVGDYVKDGADLVNLEDTRGLLVDFRLPERYLPQLRPGQAVQVAPDALPGLRLPARIEALEPLVDANGRSVLVRAALENSGGNLRPGMFARVEAVLATREDALVVPEEAIVPQAGRQFVIRVVEGKAPDGRPARVGQRTEVRLGLRRDGRVEVLEGVSAGDTVVTAGHQRLQRDGMALRIVELGAAREGGQQGGQQGGRPGGAAAPAVPASAPAAGSGGGPGSSAGAAAATPTALAAHQRGDAVR